MHTPFRIRLHRIDRHKPPDHRIIVTRAKVGQTGQVIIGLTAEGLIAGGVGGCVVGGMFAQLYLSELFPARGAYNTPDSLIFFSGI